MFGMSGMPGLLGKMKELQDRMKEAQESLVHLTASGEAGAGMVKATVNGRKQLVRLDIDPDLIKPEDREMLQDLVVAATNKALDAIDEQVKTRLSQATEGLIPNIPGFDLGNMMK